MKKSLKYGIFLMVAVILCGSLCSCSLPSLPFFQNNSNDNDTAGNSSMFTLKITSTDPKFAEVVLEAYNNNIPAFMEYKEGRENVIALNSISREATRVFDGIDSLFTPKYQTSAQYEATNFFMPSDGDIAYTTTSSYTQVKELLVKDYMSRVKSNDELIGIVLKEVQGYYDEEAGTYPYAFVTATDIKNSVSVTPS